jgi:hypothetical protein
MNDDKKRRRKMVMIHTHMQLGNFACNTFSLSLSSDCYSSFFHKFSERKGGKKKI